MKLKFELVNGYGVLYDESYFIDENTEYPCVTLGFRKILFAEKELGLDVPVFEWRDFEVEELALKKYRNIPESEIMEYAQKLRREAFIQGYKSNPARYTEEDLKKAFDSGIRYQDTFDYYTGKSDGSEPGREEYIQSLQKYPKYVVMESEIVEFAAPDRIYYDYKLLTNSEGKQQGIVKELIWT